MEMNLEARPSSVQLKHLLVIKMSQVESIQSKGTLQHIYSTTDTFITVISIVSHSCMNLANVTEQINVHLDKRLNVKNMLLKALFSDSVGLLAQRCPP